MLLSFKVEFKDISLVFITGFIGFIIVEIFTPEF